MSEIGGSEVLLLIIIGLIVLGPERLPRVANQIGSWLGQARRMTRMMRRQLEEEVNFDLKKEIGLDQPAASTEDPYRNPQFVQDRHAGDAQGEEPKTDLPDDYSPAHGADEMGTGVGDEVDENHAAAAEPEANADSEVLADNDIEAAQPATEAAPEPAKTQSA